MPLKEIVYTSTQLIFPDFNTDKMMKRFLYFLFIFACIACTPEKKLAAKTPSLEVEKSTDKFFYSTEFSKLYKVKQGTLIKDWQNLIAAEIYHVPADGYTACGLKLYLGKNINFDYPQRGDFINIMGDRYDDIFSFTDEVTAEDYKLHAQLAFKAGNLISIQGFQNKKLTASSGYNIDYVMMDAGDKIAFIKTHTMPCEVLNDKNTKYYLLLKPKGIDDFDHFMKFPLPLND